VSYSSDDDVIRRLRARRVELQDDLDRLTQPPVEGSNLGFGKRVGDGTTEAVERIASTAAARSLARSLSEIDAAIDRHERGLYGRCATCGDEIPPGRLEARPATIYCVACASL
jgi:DnaK suppressor protein